MKDFLAKKQGEKIGVLRSAVSKETYFEATLKAIEGETAVFADEQGREFAVPIALILMAGDPETLSDQLGKRAGFF